jgi:serine/threonine-protein kinase SRK2
VSAFSAQSIDDIRRIVQEAQTVPRLVQSIPGYGWGFSDSDDDDEQEDDEGEDVYDRTVRQVHESGEFDISTLRIQ